MKCMLYKSVDGRFKRGVRAWATGVVLALSGLVVGLGQTPDLISDPEDGGDFEDKLTITFLQIMKDPIAIRFEGAGGVEFDSVWQTFGGIFPNMILECTPRAALPANSTVTWTVNPDGTGFETADGQVFPTKSGTFIVSEGGGGVTVTVYPGDGDVYDPAMDGPVTLDFSEDMDLTVDLSEAISFNPGTWTFVWVGSSRVTCTLESAAEPGEYYYTLSGFRSADGDLVDSVSGSFVIEEGGTGLTVTPSPGSGTVYNPSVAGPVRFSFSEEMDLTVEPETAITFSQGNWQCEWVSSTVVECTPTSSLAVGFYTYTLTGFRSATGELMPLFAGSFVVLESGGNGGTPAPACPADPVNLPLPKTMSVCGATFFAWNHAVVFSDGAGTGYTVDGWSDTDQGSLSSLVRLDAQGRVVSTILAQDDDTELVSGPDATRVLAVRQANSSSSLVFGVYRVDNNFEAVFEHALTVMDPNPEVSFLSDGRVLVVQDLGSEIEVILFTASGSVTWAKRFSSGSFGADGSGGIPGLGGGQSVSVREMGSGFMLDVAQYKTSFAGETFQSNSTNILVRLTADGAVQWARKYTGLDTFPAPILGGTQAGGYFLQAYSTEMPEEGDPTISSLLVKLNADGDVVWGKRYADAMVNVVGDLPEGKFLVGGGIVDQEGELNRSFFGVMNSAGALETQVQIGALDYNYGFGFVDDNRIRYSVLASTRGAGSAEPKTALIGSSNLQLQDWTWRQYSKPVDSALLVSGVGSSSLIFSAFHDATHTLDIVSLNDSLQVDAECTVFANATVPVMSTNLVASTINVVVTPGTVQGANFTPQLAAGGVGMATFTVAEGDLCAGGSDPIPATLSTRHGGPGVVVLEFDTAAQFEYILQRASRLSSPDWTQVEVIAGNGTRVSRNVVSSGGESYFRIITRVP